MTNLQELIETANNLSSSLDRAAQNEKKFCFEICMSLEQMSYEIFKIANGLNEIKEYIG